MDYAATWHRYAAQTSLMPVNNGRNYACKRRTRLIFAGMRHVLVRIGAISFIVLQQIIYLKRYVIQGYKTNDQ